MEPSDREVSPSGAKPSLPLLTKALVRRAKRACPAGESRGETEPPSVVGTPILFSPDNVRNVLGRLPSVAALLPDPAVEGEPSDAFPGVLRKGGGLGELTTR
jgi:hypothetical protein